MCRVTGRRHYSQDLLQGGVEVLCMLVFQGNSKYVDKAKNCYCLLKGVLMIKLVILVKYSCCETYINCCGKDCRSKAC